MGEFLLTLKETGDNLLLEDEETNFLRTQTEDDREALNKVAQAQLQKLIKWLEEHNLLKAGGGLVLSAGDWQELKKVKDK